MRALKFAGYACAGLVVLLVVTALAIWLLLDPNDYKDRIAAEVKSATGRELALPGDIELSLFPWLALQLGPATLGNPPGFDAEPFARVQRADLRVRLLPLLRGQLQVGRIGIEGLDLRLQRNAAGRGNWEDFVTDSGSPASPSGARPLDLAGIGVTNSRIAFDALVAQGIDLDVGRVRSGEPIAVQLTLELITQPGAAPMPLAGSFEVTPDASAERFTFAPLALEGRLKPESGGAEIAWKFDAPSLSLDTASQVLAAARYDARLASAQLSGSLSGARIIDAPELRGEFSLQPVELRELLAQLAIAAPVTRDAKVLGRLGAQGEFTYANDTVSTRNLKVRLDDSDLTGSFAAHLPTDALDFDLRLDRIDLDRYLPPPTAAAGADSKQPFELPAEALKPLRARGSLAIGQARISGVTLGNLAVGIDAKDGVTRIAPARAQLYGGQYAGEVTVDSRANLPVLRIEQTLSGIDVAQLLADLADTRRLSGRGTVTTSLTARGRNSDALLRSLDGKASLSLADGAVEGMDIWYAIAQAQSLIQQRTLASASNRGRTPFDSFRASASIANGVATTRDLDIASQQLRVAGQGSANLVTQALDYDLTATVLRAPPGAEGVAVPTLAAIPVQVDGSFDDPRVRPDLKGIARAKVKEEVDKHKGEIERKVKDALKGLFDR